MLKVWLEIEKMENGFKNRKKTEIFFWDSIPGLDISTSQFSGKSN